MRYMLYLLAALYFLAGALALLVAKSAIHEIQVGVAFLISAVLLSGGAVCSHLAALTKLVEQVKPPPPT